MINYYVFNNTCVYSLQNRKQEIDVNIPPGDYVCIETSSIFLGTTRGEMTVIALRNSITNEIYNPPLTSLLRWIDSGAVTYIDREASTQKNKQNDSNLYKSLRRKLGKYYRQIEH